MFDYNYILIAKSFIKKVEDDGFKIVEGQRTFKYTRYGDCNRALSKLFFVKDYEIILNSVILEIEKFIEGLGLNIPQYKKKMIRNEVKHNVIYFSRNNGLDLKEIIRKSEDDNFGFLRWVKHKQVGD